MWTVALDTSALMAPVETGVRLFDELDRLVGEAEFVVPQLVLDELGRLADGSGEAAKAARVGLDLANERCAVVDVEAETADAALVSLARTGAVDHVVTNDRGLRDQVLAVGVPVVGLRGRNKLAVTRP